jgi:hypothetical protein
MPITLDDKLMPVARLAKVLNVHVGTVYRWGAAKGVRGHRLNLLRVGGRTYVDRDDWDRFVHALNNRNVSPPKDQARGTERTEKGIDDELDAAGL